MKRTDFLSHIAWTGTGLVYTIGATGLLTQGALAQGSGGFNFVQISDSHIGFNKPANEDTSATLKKAVDAINAMPVQPAFVMHTGDITHLSKPSEFDTAKQILGTLKAPLITIPGEHDVIGYAGFKTYAGMFNHKESKDGWYSWNQNGAHFVALVNVFNFEKMGLLGQAQIDWLAKDLAGLKNDTPLVVFGHVPLYALYPEWGWTTEDGSKVLAMLKRFSAVTVLNGHIHQIITHSEGNIRFFTAAATAYPQPAPGKAAGPGPLKVPADELLKVLGYRTVELGSTPAKVADHPLG